MALIDLTTPEMVDVSGAWLDAGSPEGKVISRAKGLVPLLMFVREAHEGLLASQVVAENPHAARIKELTQTNTELDRDHDRHVRGSILLLEASRSSPRATSGATRTGRRRSRSSPTARRRRSSPTRPRPATPPWSTSASATPTRRRWPPSPRPRAPSPRSWAAGRKVARALGESDKERTRLMEVKADGTTKSDGIQARNAWIRAVDVFRRAIPMAKLSPEDVTTILATLTKSEERGKNRGGGGGGEEGGDESGEGGEPTGGGEG
jgi:hypothetical protein